MQRRNPGRRRARGGFAMLVAMWLIVAVAVVTLEFALDAHDRASSGLAAAERGRARAADIGALALTQARLEYALTNTSSVSGAAQALRGADPWLGVDSIYSGNMIIQGVSVDVIINDLGSQLNINNMREPQLTTLLNYAIKDAGTATKVAECILDWNDVDSIPRASGAERDDYIKDGLLTIPTNLPFREVPNILQVKGVTPEIYADVEPYLTTHGSGLINLNTADTIVLRALPSMTDQTLQRILAGRSNGQRITSVAQLFPQQAAARGGRGGGNNQQQTNPAETALAAAATTSTNELALTMIAYAGPEALPVRLNAIITRTNTTTTVSWKEW